MTLILLVEDDKLVRRSLARSLHQAGYRVLATSSVEQALDAYRELGPLRDPKNRDAASEDESIAAIVCDGELPDGTALDFYDSVSTGFSDVLRRYVLDLRDWVNNGFTGPREYVPPFILYTGNSSIEALVGVVRIIKPNASLVLDQLRTWFENDKDHHCHG